MAISLSLPDHGRVFAAKLQSVVCTPTEAGFDVHLSIFFFPVASRKQSKGWAKKRSQAITTTQGIGDEYLVMLPKTKEDFWYITRYQQVESAAVNEVSDPTYCNEIFCFGHLCVFHQTFHGMTSEEVNTKRLPRFHMEYQFLPRPWLFHDDRGFHRAVR